MGQKSGHADIMAFMESIDRRLGNLEYKLDNALKSLISKDYCTECKANRVDKRYFVGISGVVVIIISVVSWLRGVLY